VIIMLNDVVHAAHILDGFSLLIDHVQVGRSHLIIRYATGKKSRPP